jgi:EAL domain-containing protein (putative c-di-GMP-specific phosphodiesterase class I)
MQTAPRSSRALSGQEYRHGELTLGSVFQPIVSLSHMRAAGYEAMLRAHDPFDRPVAPLQVFGDAARAGELLQLDRLVQSMHLANFRDFGANHEWLFLKVQPVALVDRWQRAALLANLRSMALAPQRVVLQVLEQSVENLQALADAVQFFRGEGVLVALDDFGAGTSNLDRVWHLQPDIIKLNHTIFSTINKRMSVVSIVAGLVSLFHDTGKLVLIDGVETEAEAQLAMECNADFAQGLFFGRPGVAPIDATLAAATIGSLTERYRERAGARERRDAARLAPHLRAFERAAERLVAGEALDEVCWNFLSIEGAARCFLLDAQGRQVGGNIASQLPRAAQAARFLPLAEAQGASWLRRAYFREAVAEPGVVRVTRPYLSINEASPCITLSLAVRLRHGVHVLCGDVNWAPQEDLDSAREDGAHDHGVAGDGAKDGAAKTVPREMLPETPTIRAQGIAAMTRSGMPPAS